MKCYIYISIQTLYSVLCWSTGDSDYSLESYWVWRYKLGTPVFWEFSPIFLCRCSQTLSGWMGSVAAQLFSLQRCSIGFKSRLWLGHSMTFRDVSWSHSCIVLAVCLGWTFAPVWGPELSWAGFHQWSLCTLLRSSFPRSWLVSQSLPLKNIPTAWCCHHHASP